MHNDSRGLIGIRQWMNSYLALQHSTLTTAAVRLVLGLDPNKTSGLWETVNTTRSAVMLALLETCLTNHDAEKCNDRECSIFPRGVFYLLLFRRKSQFHTLLLGIITNVWTSIKWFHLVYKLYIMMSTISNAIHIFHTTLSAFYVQPSRSI